jgi:hypothetical protein
MNSIININHVVKQSVPRPSRESLFNVIDKMNYYVFNQAHVLEKGDFIDKFFASCIKIGYSNLQAIRKLSVEYQHEGEAIFRNLVEINVDCFWLASFISTDIEKAKRLAECFFIYPKYKFIQTVRELSALSHKDIFLRDTQTYFDNEKLIDDCKANSAGFEFGRTWRNESKTFPNKNDTTWKIRAKKAADFAKNSINIQFAPYQQNLQNLSSYVHFDPAQIFSENSVIRDRLFDRDINIAIGSVYDMLVYSYTYKKWNHPKELTILQHEFIWFST